MVEDERDAEKRDSRGDGRLDGERQLPDGLAGRLHERACRGRSPDRRRVAGREQRSRAAVDDRLGRRDDEDEVGVDDGSG